MSVSCRELFKVYRTPEGSAAALQGLSFDAAAGEMVALLGPSGSGKSTLLRILAGVETPSAGSALVAGHDMAGLGRRRRALVRRRHIGFFGQHAHHALSPVTTIGESLALPLRLRGESPRVARARAEELLERVGLPASALGVRPHELSGGEAQRAALCVATVHAPDLVLADEPTGELDATAAAQVLALLRGLADDGLATVVLVTHDPAGAAAAHRVVRVRDGRVSAEDSGQVRAVVIGKGGWLHVPEDVLARAGIGNRARLRAEDRAVVLEPLEGSEATLPGEPANVTASLPARVAGARVILGAVSKRYGTREVFRQADFDFAAGRFTAITGRSGSGKSTLLQMVGGLDLPDEGSIALDDTRVELLDREQRAALRMSQVGYVAQDISLTGFLTAREQLLLPLVRAGRSRADAHQTAEGWLAAFGLGERADQRCDRLSAGERQRAALARALAGGRRLLLVDEPTSHLDEANAAAVAALLRQMADAVGVTVLCATHDPVVADAAHERLPL